MDFESIISFVLLFLFFIVPSVLKRMGKKKKSVATAKKKTSLLGKLGEQIQAFMRDLEEQAQKAKQEQEGSAWDQLDDGVDIQEPIASPDLDFEPTGTAPEDNEPELVPRFHDPEHPFLQPDKLAVSQAEINKNDLTTPEEKTHCLERVQGNLPSHALQQAVVWSEVLGKPVALRRE